MHKLERKSAFNRSMKKLLYKNKIKEFESIEETLENLLTDNITSKMNPHPLKGKMERL